MNYKVTSTRNKREPGIHAEGKPVEYVTSGGIKYGEQKKTLCGFDISNSYYSKWEKTNEPVNCKRCLRKINETMSQV